MFGQESDSKPNNANTHNTPINQLSSMFTPKSNQPPSLFGAPSNNNPLLESNSNNKNNQHGLFSNSISSIHSNNGGIFTNNLMARPSPVQKSSKASQAKPKQNPAFNFFPVKDSKEQEGEKKHSIPPQFSFFGSSSSLAPLKTEPTQASKINPVPSLFSKKPETPALTPTPNPISENANKKEDKNYQPLGLFTSKEPSHLSNVSEKKISTPVGSDKSSQRKSSENMINNRNSANTGFLDNKKELSQGENKALDNKTALAIQSIFSGLGGFPANYNSNGQFFLPSLSQNTTPQGFTLFNNKPIDNKQVSVNAQPKQTLFDNQTKQPSFSENEQNLTIDVPQMAKPLEQAQSNPTDKIKAPTSLLSQTQKFQIPSFKKTDQKTIEVNHKPNFNQSFFKKKDEVQKEEQPKLPSSQFVKNKKDADKGPTFSGTFKNGQENPVTTDISIISDKVTQKVSTNLPTNTQASNLSLNPYKNLLPQTQRLQTERHTANTSNLRQQNQGKAPRMTINTTVEKSNQPYSRSTNIPTPTFVDFKTLQKMFDSPNFDLYLTQKKREIINSIIIYFSWKQSEEKQQEVKLRASDSEKDKFYTNLTNLFIKKAQVEMKHYHIYEKYIRSVLAEENYQAKLFVKKSLNSPFILSSLIYIKDFEGQLRLNEQGSIELRQMLNMLLASWNIGKINYLNFLFQHPDLIRPPEDLFAYLLTYLIRLQISEHDQDAQIFNLEMRDYNKHVSSKLVELLEYYNKKLVKNYKKVLTSQPQKFIINLLPSIERLKNPTNICLVLRVIMNSIDLKSWEKIDKNLIMAVKQTKSTIFLPLRAILSKLKHQKVEFILSPKDLFKYVIGDEWVDWIEIYLASDDLSNIEISRQEINCLMQSLCTLSSKLLLERLINPNKSIYKLFVLLKEQNLVEHYYRIMQLCLSDEQSIKQINQFYFKKTDFSIEYQEIKEYVLNFHENMSKPALEVTDPQTVIRTLFPKISLITKILEIEPEKLLDLEVLIFDPDSTRKKIKLLPDIELQSRRGHKLAHLLIDIINIVSVKWLQTKILAKIFKVMHILLRNKKTQGIMIAVMNINKPSFKFIEKAQLARETNEEISWLLYHIVRSTYVEDLIINSSKVLENSSRMQMFYTLRYNSAEYCNLMQSVEQVPKDFSIYWINQLFIAASKQKFNPTILNVLLTKLYIIPSPFREDPNPVDYGIKKYRRNDWKVPKVFEMIVNLVNSFSIWQQLNKVLEYKIVKDKTEWKLINLFNPSSSIAHQTYIFSCLKLLRTIFTLNQLLIKCQIANPNHFITRTLSSLTILNKIETSSKMSLNNRNNMLASLLALIRTGQLLQNDSYRIIAWQVEQQQEDKSKMQAIFDYIKKNQRLIDFSQAINFTRSPDNMYYDCIDNISTLSLECIIHFLRLSKDNYFQVCMLKGTENEYQEKLKMKTDLMKKLSNTFTTYFSQEKLRSIRYKFLQFIYDLKYNLGKNKLNQGLADLLFADFLKVHNAIDNDVRLNHLILLYLQKDLSQNKHKFESHLEPIVQGVIRAFQLRNTHTQDNAVIRNTSEIGNILLRYFQKEYSLCNLNQMERIIDQKAIIEIGDQLQTLHLAVQILTKLLSKKSYSNKLSPALIALNRLIAEKNLILLINDIPFQYSTLPKNQLFQFQERSKRPRQFLRDPLQMFLSQNKSVQQKREIQEMQKNNIIQWIMQISQRLTEKLTTYLLFALTINKTFYANNPIEFNVVRSDLANKDIFCHLSLGTTSLSAVQIFGKSEADAVQIVQVISQNIINRLVILHQTLKQTGNRDGHDAKNYLQGLNMLGFSLQWLRNKRKGQQFGAKDVVRKINRNYHFLLPNGQSNFHKQQLKLIQSYLSMGEPVPNHIKFDIQHYLYHLINSYNTSLDSLENQNKDQEVGLLAQQSFAILILNPPASNEQVIHRQLLSIWSKQKNQSYFFNQSRLILELASLYPEQMAKLKILSQYQLYSGLRPTQERYQLGERTIDSMKWIWALHIVTALVTSSDSVLVVDQVSSFVIKNKTQLYKTLQGDQKKITRAYAQQLQVTLNLISILLTNSLWITKNSSMLEEITYIMSHNLNKYFVGIAQGKIVLSPESTNQKILNQLRVSTVYEESEMVQELQGDQYESIFGLQIKIKTIYCLKFYLIAMEIAFFKSHYIQKHFNSNVFGTSRYLSSFWDSFIKDLVVLFNYTINKTQDWLKVKKTKQLFQLMNNCYNAPHTFIQNGFLTSIIELPQTDSEIFSDLYLLCFLVTKLAVTHFIRMRTYISKFNAMITAQNEKFGARIKEHITRVGELNEKLTSNCHTFITYQSFKKQAEIIDSRKTLK